MDNVQAGLAEQGAEQQEAQQPKRIQSLEEAARYAYGLSETRKEIEKVKQVAEAERSNWLQKIKEVDMWQEEALKPLIHKEQYLSGLLMDFHRRQYEEAPNEKAKAKVTSIKLPYGVTLKSRKPTVNITVTDDTAYRNYMMERGFYEEQPAKLKWAEAKKHWTVLPDGRVVDDQGEVIPFVSAVEGDRSFKVE